MGVKIASSRGQICIILHNSHHEPCQNPPKVASKSSSAHHGELLAEELGFAEENSEFEPLMHPKSDTHCPHPIPATSSMQMGAYPSTHTHPEFSSGNTRHPPTHDKMWSGRQPWLQPNRATWRWHRHACHTPRHCWRCGLLPWTSYWTERADEQIAHTLVISTICHFLLLRWHDEHHRYCGSNDAAGIQEAQS